MTFSTLKKVLIFGLNLELSGTSLGNFGPISDELDGPTSNFGPNSINELSNESVVTKIRTARSGFLDAESLLNQALMFMQPDAYKRFAHFYENQVMFVCWFAKKQFQNYYRKVCHGDKLVKVAKVKWDVQY